MIPVIPPSGFVHLAIDLMPYYMRGLPRAEQERLWADVRRFADELKELGIPTIWVSFSKDFQIYESELTRNPDTLRFLTQYLELQECKPKAGETIVIKNAVDAFCNAKMRNFLKREYPETHTLLFSGGYASQCVAHTALSGLRLDYRCMGVTDLLFEENQPAAPPPTYHRKQLRNAVIRLFREDGYQAAHFRPFMNRLDYDDRQGVLQLIREAPARPVLQAARPDCGQRKTTVA